MTEKSSTTCCWYYQPPFFKGQHGFAGHALGGWTISPIFTAGSGAPVYCNTNTDAESFGSADAVNFSTNEQCVFNSFTGISHSVHKGVAGDATTGVGTATAGATPSTELNLFADPLAVWNNVRPPILGIDTRDGGVGPIKGLPYWNMDLSIKKNFKVTERVNLDTQFVFTNVFNHNQFYDPTLDITNPGGWGVITAQGNNPRQIQFGVRASFYHSSHKKGWASAQPFSSAVIELVRQSGGKVQRIRSEEVSQ